MMTAEFNKLLNALTQLTDLRTKRLEKALKGENPAQIIINVLEQRLVTIRRQLSWPVHDN
jgi:hypothetical protein